MGGGSGASQPVGSVDVALAHAVRLLEREPRLAAEQASEILKAVPGHANATLLLGIAHRVSGNAAGSLEVLEMLLLEADFGVPVSLRLVHAVEARAKRGEVQTEQRPQSRA